MDTICAGCKLRVEPITVFEKSPRSSKWWSITRCPRERCGFNIDIDEANDPNSRPIDKGGNRYFWKGDRWE